jgi:hypothetical protein
MGSTGKQLLIRMHTAALSQLGLVTGSRDPPVLRALFFVSMGIVSLLILPLQFMYQM